MTLNPLRDLPNGWAWATVAEVGDATTQIVTTGPFGTALGREDFQQSGVPVLTIGCLTHAGISLAKAVHVTSSKAALLSRYRLRPGDLLFSRMASVGRVGIVPTMLDGALFNYHIMRLRLRPNLLLSTFFMYYVRGAREVEGYLREVNHGATRDGINTQQLLGLPVSVPPLTEQHRIVDEIEKHLTRVDAAVAALERVRSRLKQYRTSVLKAACEGRLVPTEAELARAEGRDYEPASVQLDEILGERRARREAEQRSKMKAAGKAPKGDGWKPKYRAPKPPSGAGMLMLPPGWAWAHVSDIAEVQLGRQRSPKHHTGPHMRPYLRAANVRWTGLDLSDVNEMNFPPADFDRHRLEPGDLLLAEASGSASEVGKPALWRGEIAGCCFQNTLIRVRSRGPYVKYLFWHFFHDAVSGRFGDASRGVGIHHLGAEGMSDWRVALPPFAEQQRIVAEVERRLSVVEGIEASMELTLRRADRLRQAILRGAFDGRLVPQDANDEPATLLLERIRSERAAAPPTRGRRQPHRAGVRSGTNKDRSA